MREPLLDVRALDAFYGDFQALFGVSLEVAPGEVVARERDRLGQLRAELAAVEQAIEALG